MVGDTHLGEELGEMLRQAVGVVNGDVALAHRHGGGWIAHVPHSEISVAVAVVFQRGVFVVETQAEGEGERVEVIGALMVDGDTFHRMGEV